MSRIDLLDWVRQACFLSTLEITKGYWQVPLTKEDREKNSLSHPLWPEPLQKDALRTTWGCSYYSKIDG